MKDLIATVLLAMTASGCHHGMPAVPPASSGSIGPGGGTVGSASAGEIVVPPGALAAVTTISIGPGMPIAAAGYQATGFAFALGPSGTTFATPVLVTIPVVVPAGKALDEMFVLEREDATDLVRTLVPASTDSSPQTVTVSVTSFSTVQGAIATGSTPGVFGLSRFGQATFQ